MSQVPMLDEDVVGLGLTLSQTKTDGRKGSSFCGLANRWLPGKCVPTSQAGL
jgi:hypothetical protein